MSAQAAEQADATAPDLSALSLPDTLSYLRDAIAAENGVFADDERPEAKDYVRLNRLALTKLSEAEAITRQSERRRERLGDPTRPYQPPVPHRTHPVCGSRHHQTSGRDPRLPPGRPHP